MSDMLPKDGVLLTHNVPPQICHYPAIRGDTTRSRAGRTVPTRPLDPNRPQPEPDIALGERYQLSLRGGCGWQHLLGDPFGCSWLGADCSGVRFSRLSARHADMVGSGAPFLSAAVEASTSHPKSRYGSERRKAVHALRLSRRRCTGARDATGVPQYHRVRDGTARGDRSSPRHQPQFSEFVLRPTDHYPAS